MKKLIDSISVFYPCFNEEVHVETTTKTALKILNIIADRYEVILINDGSKDKTPQIINELAKKYKHIRTIHNKVNLGYGGALQTGFYNAKYEWIATHDADGQFDFSEITKLIKKAKETDSQAVVGFRLNRQDSLVRKINGKGWTFLANILLGINLKDVDCSFKLVKKEVIDKIPHLESMRGGMISPELWAKTKKAGFKISEVGVHHFPRTGGKQSGAELRIIIKSFVDLFKLWWKIR
jgi:glycosyltransferase involved in cell wall biosynthesis